MGNGAARGITDRITPTKPLNDARAYRVFTLASGMRVVAISDRVSTVAGATLHVRVGSESNPDELPGLAHYLEHMVLRGSQKFPNENAFATFVESHGGANNAQTHATYTDYHFHVSRDHLRGALNIMADMIATPLFTRTAAEREILAVDNEYSNHLKDDNYHYVHILHDVASRLHPYHKFTTGNVATLRDVPQAKGIDVLAALREFHAAHYSADRMSLCVCGPDDLDSLERMVAELFAVVPVRATPAPPRLVLPPELADTSGFPFCDEQPQWLSVVPIKNLSELRIIFSTPITSQYYKHGPLLFLARFINDRGPGSLHALLVRKNWATEIQVAKNNGLAECENFVIIFTLTEEGVLQAREIVYLTFQLFQLIREEGIQEWRFNELRTISQQRFDFELPSELHAFTRSLAESIWLHTPQDVLTGSKVAEVYDAETLRSYVDMLSPKQLRIMVRSRQFKDKTDKIDPWLGAHYKQEPIDRSWIQEWQTPSRHPNLSLPAANEFILKEVIIKPAPKPRPGVPTLPVMLLDTPAVRLWHKQGTRFPWPRATVKALIYLPAVAAGPVERTLARIYIGMLLAVMGEELHSAVYTGVTWRVAAPNENGLLEITITALGDILPRIALRIFNEMKHPTLDAFRVTSLMLSDFGKSNNMIHQSLSDHAFGHVHNTLCSGLRTIREAAQTILELNSADIIGKLQAFMDHVIDEASLELLIVGNILPDEAVNLTNQIVDTLGYRPVPRDALPKKECVQLNAGEKYVIRESKPDQKVNCADVYMQIGLRSIEVDVKLGLLFHFLKEPAFFRLRTKEQLGYIVSAQTPMMNGVHFLRITIQSNTHDPAYMDDRIENFLRTFETDLTNLADAAFAAAVKLFIAKRNTVAMYLDDDVARDFPEVVAQTYVFDRKQREIEVLKRLAKTDLLAFYQEHVTGAATRRRFSVQLYGSETPMPELMPSDGTAMGLSMESKREFQRRMPRWV